VNVSSAFGAALLVCRKVDRKTDRLGKAAVNSTEVHVQTDWEAIPRPRPVRVEPINSPIYKCRRIRSICRTLLTLICVNAKIQVLFWAIQMPYRLWIIFRILPSVLTLMSLVGSTKNGNADDHLFRGRITHVLERSCLSCHNEKEKKGGLSLETAKGFSAGGESGPAIDLEQPSNSILVEYVSGRQPQMPKKGSPLAKEEVQAITEWVAAGAKWPEGVRLRDRHVVDTNWWSLQPLVSKPALPRVSALDARWVRTPIDAFIVSKLREKGLGPSIEADGRTLCRRLYFDLIGLPPSPAEFDAFEKASSVDTGAAYSQLVEKLLASPRYGERWARHWLDVVHYADTHGYDKDQPRPNAWPYRDYVIRSLNEDKPYARFVQEQLAGDFLYPDAADCIPALGFISAGPWDLIGHAEVPESKIDGKIARHLDRDDMVGNAIGALCSTTVQCAQCHNHKFDPISQDDYYSLQAVFSALDRAEKTYDLDPAVARTRKTLARQIEVLKARRDERSKKATLLAGDALAAIDKRIAELKRLAANREAGVATAKLEQARRLVLEAMLGEKESVELRSLELELAGLEEKIGALGVPCQAYAGTVHRGNAPFEGTGAKGGKPRPIFLLTRGQVTLPGREVGPGALTAVSELRSRFEIGTNEPEGARRAALAKWITDEKNPLTWRSIVNRVWQYHFGQGIVETPNDLGRMGAIPSHPELLDWLAADFRDCGGSLKRLHRLIVTSAAYRQTSNAGNERAWQLDARNTLLWRQNRRKLEAEAMRDAVLAVSGKLDLTIGGPGWQDFVIEHPEHSPHYRYDLADPNDPRTWRRSIYRFIVRSQMQPFMTALDCADPSMRVDKRNESVSPAQALALLNNGFMVTQAVHFAARVKQEAGPDANAQVERAFRLAVGHGPSWQEREKLSAFVGKWGLPNLCRLLLNLNEFAFVD